MAVVTNYGTGYPDPSINKLIDATFAEARKLQINSKVSIANGDSIASSYKVGRVPSNAIIDPRSTYFFDALTGVTDMDIGIGSVADALVNGDDVSAGGSQTLAGHGTLTRANMNKQAWELAGLSKDPGGLLDITATINTAATAAGVVQFVIDYSRK